MLSSTIWSMSVPISFTCTQSIRLLSSPLDCTALSSARILMPFFLAFNLYPARDWVSLSCTGLWIAPIVGLSCLSTSKINYLFVIRSRRQFLLSSCYHCIERFKHRRSSLYSRVLKLAPLLQCIENRSFLYFAFFRSKDDSFF